MTENILFLCHVEDSFRKYFPDKMYVPRLIKACSSSKYDQVIALVSNIMDYDPIDEINNLVTDKIDFAWGYEPDMFDDDSDELDYVIEASHKSLHEYTWIPLELRNKELFYNKNIFVGGGCNGECLADFEVVLEHLEVDYKLIEGYVY